MLRVVKQFRSLFIVSSCLLTLVFLFNIFGVQSQGWFNNFQKDSGALVVHKLACHEELGSDKFGGMLVKGKDSQAVYSPDDRDPVCQKEVSKEYVSQYGLQGKVSEVGYRLLNGIPGVGLGNYIILLHILWAALTAAVLSLFVVWVARTYGRFVAVSVLLFLCLSVWIIGFARNLYWATPLLFLPFIFTLYYYAEPGKTRRYGIFLGGLLALFFIRFLNGFEYVPTIILSVVAVAGLVSYERSASLKQFVREAALIGVVGAVAFAGAVGLTFYQVYRYVGDMHKARNLIVERALVRTTEGGDDKQFVYSGLFVTSPTVYESVSNYVDLGKAEKQKPPVLTAVLWLLSYTMLPVVNVPLAIKEPVYTIVSSFGFFVVVTWLAMRNLLRTASRATLSKLKGLQRGLWMGLVASLSWLVFGYSHTLVHAHLNGIMYYLPFMLFAYIALGLWIEQFVKKYQGVFDTSRLPKKRSARS